MYKLLMFTLKGPCEEVVREGSQEITLEKCDPEEEVDTESITDSVIQIKVNVEERIMKVAWSGFTVDCYVAYVCEETGGHLISDESGPKKFDKNTQYQVDLTNTQTQYVILLLVTDPQSEEDTATLLSNLVPGLSVTVCGKLLKFLLAG